MRMSRFWLCCLTLCSVGMFTLINCGTPQPPSEHTSEVSTQTEKVSTEVTTQEPTQGEPTQKDAGSHETMPEGKDPIPTFNPTVCGAEPHKWLPTKEAGKLITKEHSPLFSLSKKAIEALIKATRYKGLATVKYGVNVYKFRYVTQDHGKTVEATGVMAFPKVEEDKKEDFPYVLWLHGTTGFMDQCAPSRSRDGISAVALVAALGHIAVAPDYIGMNGIGDASTQHHPYLVGEATALASLDSLRAADTLMKEESKNVKSDGRMVIWGGSQGGHATLFSMLYAPYYAPEYKLVAGVAIIPPVDLIAQSEAAVAKLGNASITLAAGAAAISRWYGFGDKLSEVLTNGAPYHLARELPKMMDSKCDVDAKKYKFTKTTDIFTDALYKAVVEKKDWKGFEKWRCMLAENSLNHTSVKRINDVPVMYIVSGKDELVNPAIQRKSFDALCKQGYRMNYVECKGASHTKGAIWSLPLQFKWVEDRLAGKEMKDVCKRHDPICCPGSDSKVCTP